MLKFKASQIALTYIIIEMVHLKILSVDDDILGWAGTINVP